MEEKSGKSPLILRTKGHGTKFFSLNLKQYPLRLSFKRFPDLLLSKDSDYPSTPLYYDKKGIWNEVLLSEALINRVIVEDDPDTKLQGFYRELVEDRFKDHFYSVYKTYTTKAVIKTRSFVLCVISLALEYGFKGQVISVDKKGLGMLGVKQPTAKDVLRKLHDKGILISMAGHGLPFGNPRKSMPMAFMLHPAQEESIVKMVNDLISGKVLISDIKEL